MLKSCIWEQSEIREDVYIISMLWLDDYFTVTVFDKSFVLNLVFANSQQLLAGFQQNFKDTICVRSRSAYGRHVLFKRFFLELWPFDKILY